MGVAETAAQLAMYSKNKEQEAFDNLIQTVKMERVKRLGRQLMDGGDFSPEGLMKFAKNNNIQIDEMQGLVQMVGQFQKMQQQNETTVGYAPGVGLYKQKGPRAGEIVEREQASQDPLINKIDASKFTPESMAKFSQSRNYSDLNPLPSNNDDADVKKRIGFEALYPQYKGMVGTKEYADAFRDYTNKTAEKLQISIQGAQSRSDIAAAQKEKDERPYTSLDEVPQNIRAQAEKMTKYEIPYPGAFALKTPYWQRVIETAEMIDPNFDASMYQTRMKTRNDFNTGKSARNITSLNTVVGHLDSLMNAADQLSNSDWQSVNWAENQLSKYLPISQGLVDRQGKLTATKTAFNAVKGEMAAIFKQTGATDQEIKSWGETIDDPTTATPSQWKSFKNEALKLMGSRTQSLSDQWENGMGSPKNFRFLSDKSRNILTKIGANPDEIDPVYGSKQTKTETPKDSGVQKRLPGETMQDYLKRVGTK